MQSLLTITWDMSRGLDLGIITLRYYSLLFALGFVLGYMLMKRIFKKEGVPQEKLDTLLTYIVVATIVGARLGHVFFYQWDYYSENLLEIFMVWEGGLASHGAAVAIIIAVIIYCRKVLKKPALWMLDRIVLTVILAAVLIRVGNWFNSEIYGDIENSAFQTVFTDPPRQRIMASFDKVIESVEYTKLGGEEITDTIDYPLYNMQFEILPGVSQEVATATIEAKVIPYVNSFDKENRNIIFPEGATVVWNEAKPNIATVEVLGVPRSPTQLYEAFAYFLIFLTLYRLYLVKSLANKQGFIFGMFLIMLWGFRFFIEYFKEVQVTREVGQSLNTGQYLSIPLIIAGIYFVVAAKNKSNE